jgi:hypothetical protein
VESLQGIADAALTDALIRLMFSHFENIHIQPQWWETLPTSHQDTLVARLYESANPLTLQTEGFLTDDGLRFDRWPVVNRRCIGFEL